jgi:hypothetical protein
LLFFVLPRARFWWILASAGEAEAGSLESNVRGIYLVGVIVAGSRTNEIFIENGRHHGKLIATALAGK